MKVMSYLLLDMKLHVVLEINIMQHYADLWLQHGDKHFIFWYLLFLEVESHWQKEAPLKCTCSWFSDIARNNHAVWQIGHVVI